MIGALQLGRTCGRRLMGVKYSYVYGVVNMLTRSCDLLGDCRRHGDMEVLLCQPSIGRNEYQRMRVMNDTEHKMN
jgi:hypothetical protein